MKLVSFLDAGQPIRSREEGKLGLVLDDDKVINMLETAPRYLAVAAPTESVPMETLATMRSLLESGDAGLRFAHDVAAWADHHREDIVPHAIDEVVILSPVPRPPTMRDAYAFRQHVEAARRNRGVDMIPEYDEIPVFYFTNPMSVSGPGDVEVLDKHLDRLDFELECAVVIGKEGRNIKASEADDYVFGYMIYNDWSARGLQMHEMKLNLGPAKGKDFANSFGPWLVTRDQLASRKVEGDDGERYDLKMTGSINGKQISEGNVKDMTWTFAQIIERASYGCTLYPGDVIGSGTVGTGCFLELNGSGITDQWLKEGDVVELSIDELGTLTNTIVKGNA